LQAKTFTKLLTLFLQAKTFTKEKSFLSTGSFYQTLRKFNQNASRKENFTKETKRR